MTKYICRQCGPDKKPCLWFTDDDVSTDAFVILECPKGDSAVFNKVE